MKVLNYEALRKNNSMNVRTGRRTKGKVSCMKDKVSVRCSEGEDEADYYTNTAEIVGSQTRNSVVQFCETLFQIQHKKRKWGQEKAMLILFWMAYSWFLWRTERKYVPYCFWWLFSTVVVVLAFSFDWSVVSLKCRVSFRCTVMWFVYTCVCIYVFWI